MVVSEANFKTAITSSYDVSLQFTVKSTETSVVGTRKAIPVSFHLIQE
jgi:hypothetical protein